MPNRAGHEGISAAVLAGGDAIGQRIVTLLTAGDIDVLPREYLGDEDGWGFDGTPDVAVLACASAAAHAKRLILDFKRDFPDIPVVAVVRGRNGSRLARAALEAHADGVVYSEQIGKALVPTVRAVSAEQVVLPQAEYRRAQPVVLSHRERQVLGLAVRGMTNDAIGRKLYISRSTVKSHLTSAFAKLSVRSRSEAATVLLDPREPASRQVFADGLDGISGLTPAEVGV